MDARNLVTFCNKIVSARGIGCNIWAETNCVVKEVLCNGTTGPKGGDGTPSVVATRETAPCGDITITYGNGQIEMAGVAGQNYYFKVNAINQNWALVYNCYSNCGSTQTATGLAPGAYSVTIFDEKWRQHCQTKVVLLNNFTNEESAKGRAAAKNSIETTEHTAINMPTFNQAKAVKVSLFPNPAIDQLNVNLEHFVGQRGHLYLSNQMGQVVKEVAIDRIENTPVQLYLGQLVSGVYHLTIVAEGQLITTEKVMIQQR